MSHLLPVCGYNSGLFVTQIASQIIRDSASQKMWNAPQIIWDLALMDQLRINKSNLTLAGQTSPGGITLVGYPTFITGSGNTFDEVFGAGDQAIDDIIVRHMRFRTGDFNAQSAEPDNTPIPGEGNGNRDLFGNNADAITVWRAERVILDHVSASWSMDETLSVTVSKDVTIQHSLIAESLKNSFHHEGPHGYGSLVRGELTAQDQQLGAGGYTFYGNLYAHHDARNPAVGGQQSLEPGQPAENRREADVNFVNNVIYNWGSQPTHSVSSDVRMNYVGNYAIAGPDTPSSRSNRAVVNTSAYGMLLFQDGNFIDADRDNLHNGHVIDATRAEQAFIGFRTRREQFVNLDGTGDPFNFFESVDGSVVAADEAYQRVVASAGASLNRDEIDQRYIDDLIHRTGAIIDTQEQLRTADGILPGIDDVPVLSRSVGFDVDGDGMSDRFETIFGLDASNPLDRNDTTLSAIGYTNLEVYLDAMAGVRAGDLDLDRDVDPIDANRFLQFFDSEPGVTLLNDPELLDMEAQLVGVVMADRRYTTEDHNAYAALYDAVNGQGAFANVSEFAQTPLQAGDADQDFDFDQFDLIKVQQGAKYRTGESATWGEGDWDGAPGGSQGNPPTGDGVFNQFDVIAAQQGATYLTGPYGAIEPGGRIDDGHTSVIYNADRGEMAIDAPAGVELTSINIDSASGILIGEAARNLGGSFDNEADDNIFKATFGSSFGSLSLGNVARPGLSEEFMLGDLTVIGSLAGGGDLGEVDLVYVPEPSTALLFITGVTLGLLRFQSILNEYGN